MKFKTLMIIKALVCLFFGIALLAFPNVLYGIFGATLSVYGLFAAREYAASLFGNMVLTWMARDVEKSIARRAITLGMLLYNAIGAVTTLVNVLNGVLNWLGWGIVAVYLFFAIGFGYFWFTEKE